MAGLGDAGTHTPGLSRRRTRCRDRRRAPVAGGLARAGLPAASSDSSKMTTRFNRLRRPAGPILRESLHAPRLSRLAPGSRQNGRQAMPGDAACACHHRSLPRRGLRRRTHQRRRGRARRAEAHATAFDSSATAGDSSQTRVRPNGPARPPRGQRARLDRPRPQKPCTIAQLLYHYRDIAFIAYLTWQWQVEEITMGTHLRSSTTQLQNNMCLARASRHSAKRKDFFSSLYELMCERWCMINWS